MVHKPCLFEDLDIINRVLQPNFKSACLEIGLLEDDNEWNQFLQKSFIIKKKKKRGN